jgi:hypothetical protein
MAEDLMDKVFSFFSSDGLSDEKHNMLKGIAKELSQSKYSRFFKVRSEEVDPSFTSYLFSVYKIIYPIKEFYKDQKKLTKLKSLIVESCIDNNIREITKRLDAAVLNEKAKTMSPEDLIASIQADVDLLVSQFGPSRIAAVDHRYELARNLGQFVNFNFFGFFRKFDTHFADGTFIIEPKFPAVKTILIIDQLGDFLGATQPLKPEDNWAGLLELLKECNGSILVIPEQFEHMIKTIREIHVSKIIQLMVQYTLRNPVWQYRLSAVHEPIGQTWLELKKSEAYEYIGRINNAKKNRQINALTKQVFESSDLVRLENYTVLLSENYQKRNVEYYLYAEGLKYLQAFIDDYIEKEMKELCDILLIRGQWTNNTMSREMSQNMHIIIETLNSISELESLLAEDGPDGSRLRAAMLRIDRDPTQARTINVIVSKNNEKALETINQAAQALIVIGKHLKNLIEDLQKKHPELLVNWRELNLASKEPLTQRMVADFKRINYFIQLMHLCTQ